jgi:Fe-S oxidoreductase
MLKSQLLAAIQKEIYRHDFSHFEEKGVVVAGCPTCRRRIQSMNEFLDHLAKDAMPRLLDRLSSEQ